MEQIEARLNEINTEYGELCRKTGFIRAVNVETTAGKKAVEEALQAISENGKKLMDEAVNLREQLEVAQVRAIWPGGKEE